MAELASAWVSIFPKFDKNFSSSVGNSVKSSVTSAMSAASVAAGNVLASGISKAMGAVSAQLGSAIQRTDTIANYPKMMANLGYSTDEAAAAIQTMSKATEGLPTKLNDLVSASTKLAPLRDSLGDATEETIALNNALLSGGKDATIQANALEQYTQMLSLGKVDLGAWRSMVTAMPAQMDQLASSILGAGKKNMDLYKAMQSGEVTFAQFGEALKKLNKEGVGEFASFEEQARTATQGIGTAIENAQSRISKAVSKVIDHIGQEKIAGVINDFSSQFGGIADAVIHAMDWIAPHLKPLQDAFESLSQVDLSGFMRPLVEVGKDLIPIITSTLSTFVREIGENLAPLSEVFGGIATDLGDTIGDAFLRLKDAAGPIVDALSSVVGIIAQIFALKWETIIDVVTRIAPLIADIVNALAPIAQDILGLIGDTLDTVFATYDAHEGDIREGLGEILSGLTDLLHAVLEPIGDIIRDVILPLFGDLANSVDGLDLGSVIGESLHLAADNVRTFVEQAKELLGGIWDHVVEFWGPAYEGKIKPILDKLMELLGHLWSLISETLVPFITDSLLPMLQPLFEALEFFAGTVLDALLTILSGIMDVLNYLMPIVQKVLDDYVIPFIQKWLPPLVDFVSKILEVIGAFVDTLVQLLMPILSEVAKFLGETICKAIALVITTIDSLIEAGIGVADWFGHLPENIGKAFEDLGNIITAPFKAAFNAIADFWNSTIGQLSWDVPDWVPGIGGQKIGAPKLPKLADGGIATSETQAIVGEGASPEAIIPLDRRGLAFLADAGFTRGGNDGDDGDDRGELAFIVNGSKLAEATNADYNAVNGSYSIYSSRGLAVSR